MRGWLGCCLLWSCVCALPAVGQENAPAAVGHAAATVADRPWNQDVIYFALMDRFRDGDPDNNIPAGSDPGLFDPTQRDLNRYHGGDLRGLELAIESGYFRRLGVTALWVTPPVRNAWYSAFDLGGGKTGYHGYWAQDFLDIDPHWTSRRSLAGRDYPDNRDGRMEHYRDFVALAHRHGLKVIQDIVCNHVGPLFFYDQNGDGRLDRTQREEWIAPFLADSRWENARWMEVPEWNLFRAGPGGPQVILGETVRTQGLLGDLAVFGRRGFNDDSLGKSDGEEVSCDFFALRDLATSREAPHFDRLVDEFVEIYRFYVEEIGVDGLRIDTVKHVDHEFWDAFTARLRQRLGPARSRQLLMFGEVYDGNPRALGRYTFRRDFPMDPAPSLDSLLNFQFCFNLRGYLRPRGSEFGSARGIADTFSDMGREGARAFYNPQPGPDGLRANQKLVNFFENHDGLNRFLVRDVDPLQNQLALALTLLVEGIPCLYYGTEAELRDVEGVVGEDGESGRLTFCRGGDGVVLERATASPTFRLIRGLTALRQGLPELHAGRQATMWVDAGSETADDGLFVFSRYLTDENGKRASAGVIVACNAQPGDTPAEGASSDSIPLVSGDGVELRPQGMELQELDLSALFVAPENPETWWKSSADSGGAEIAVKDGKEVLKLQVPPRSIRIWRWKQSGF